MATKKRRVRGPTEQQKITLPLHLWSIIDAVVELVTDAYRLNGGRSKFARSDLLESAAEQWLLSLQEDLGEVPIGEGHTKSEREDFVKRLAERLKKDIYADFWSRKVH